MPEIQIEWGMLSASVYKDSTIISGGTTHNWRNGIDVTEVFETKTLSCSTA